MHIIFSRRVSAAVCLVVSLLTCNADAQGKPQSRIPEPTVSGIAYGSHPKQTLSIWKAESATATPLVFYIHGGGWRGGTPLESNLIGMLAELLENGISVVSIQYRYIQDAVQEGIKPPVKAPMQDAARALQFVRTKAGHWNFDPNRIAASGRSAGACTSLWLAFHDDLADPGSADPIARESTRLFCAATIRPQTTLDPKQMKQWTPNSKYGGHAFGIFKPNNKKFIGDFPRFLARRDQIKDWIKEYSPYSLVTADDPPVYLFYSNEPAIGQKQKDPTHTSNFGVMLQRKLESTGVESELFYPGIANPKHRTVKDYLIKQLTSQGREGILKIDVGRNKTKNALRNLRSIVGGV